MSARGRRSRDERGAVAMLVGFMSILLVGVCAFVVDLGMQRTARADMQALVDVVAGDLVGELDGRTVDELATATPSLLVLAERSRDRNPDTLGAQPVMAVRVGEIGSGGEFVELDSGMDVPTAVEVSATTRVEFAFAPGSGSATRSAVAASTSFACYKIGSWALAADTSDSVLLDPVLRQLAMQGGAFTNGGVVNALSYRGLADATVELNDLAAELGVGSLNELATATVGLADFYAALEALAQPANSTTINVLHALAVHAKTTATVQLGQILALDAGSASLAGATANVLDLVGGSISVLNGTNVANVYIGATIPSLTSAGVQLTLIQGPKQFCGVPGSPTTTGVASDTEQLRIRIGGNLNPTNIDFVPPAISGLLNSVASARITAENYVTFDLSAAGTSSRLAGVTCGDPSGVQVAVENGLATVTVQTPLRAKVVGSLLGVASAEIAINAMVKVVATVSPSGEIDVTIEVPPQAYDTPYPTGASGISLGPAEIQGGASVSANVRLLGGLLGAHIALTNNQKNQILDTVINSGLAALFSPTDPHSIASTVIDPMLALIGARVGGSDLILDSVPALECGRPRLVG